MSQNSKRQCENPDPLKATPPVTPVILPGVTKKSGRTQVVLHWCFIIQRNPDIYISTIFIFHMAGEGVGLELRRDGEVVVIGRRTW